MSRRRAKRDATNVSLFPFLAVLLCTMGALIVLLIVIAQQARAQGSQTPPPDPKLAQQRAQQQAEYARLLQQADALKSQVNAAAALLAEKQADAARLRGDVAQAARQLAQLEGEQSQLARSGGNRPTSHRLARQAADLDARLRELRGALLKKQRQAGQPQELFSIVPYAGRNGVARRPIYIECREDSIVLLPEGTELQSSDFDVLTRGNPLEAAVRATVDHWERTLGQRAGQPYPLLLVRPGGVTSYYAARAALSTWGNDYGYELIDKDWKLALPQRDEALAGRQQQAVAAARQQMSRLARTQTLRRRSTPSFKVSSSGGLERIDRGGGDGDGRGRGSGGSRRSGFGGPPAGSGLAPGLAASQRRAGNGPVDSRGSSGTGSGTHGFGSTDSGSVFGQGRDSGADNPLGSRFAPPGGNGSTGTNQQETGSFSGGLGQGDSPSHHSGGRGGPSGTSSPSGSSFSSGSGGGSPQSTTGSTGQGSTGQGSTGQGSTGQGSTGGFGQPSSGGASGSGGGTCECIAEEQGADWALPTKPGRGSSPLRRNVRLLVEGETVTVFADPRAARTLKVIRLRDDTTGAMTDLKDAVGKLIQGWGTAPPGFHWRPMLWAQVAPSGTGRYRELEVLLRDSGFELTELRSTPR